MKRILSFVLLIILVSEFAACSTPAKTDSSSASTAAAAAQEKTEMSEEETASPAADSLTEKDTAETVKGEIVRLVSDFNGKQAQVLGADVLLEDGKNVFLDINKMAYEQVKSNIVWKYVYANDHSDVVSDVVCTEGSSITFTLSDGSEVVIKAGAVINLVIDDNGEYQLS